MDIYEHCVQNSFYKYLIKVPIFYNQKLVVKVKAFLISITILIVNK